MSKPSPDVPLRLHPLKESPTVRNCFKEFSRKTFTVVIMAVFLCVAGYPGIAGKHKATVKSHLPVVPPTVATRTSFNIYNTSATMGGSVSSDGGGAVTERGVVWGYRGNPTTADNKVIVGSGTGSFTIVVKGLTPSSEVYVRAYAINSAGISYGVNTGFLTSPNLTVSPAQVNVSCNGGSNGSATLTVYGGRPPYIYNWTGTSTTTEKATGLAKGTYSVLVTDADAATVTKSITITEPTALSAVTSQTDAIGIGAKNGSATITVSGGTGAYTYIWAPLGGIAAKATGLGAGTYTATATDAKGCSISRNFTIAETVSITATTSQTNVTCNGSSNGSATVVPSSGVLPYTYAWSPYGGTAATATGLAAGTYTVTIKDATLASITKTITITEPAAITASTISQTNIACNGGRSGAATISASGGTGAGSYTYSWAPLGGNTPSISGRPAAIYSCIITDANGCTTTKAVTLTQPTAITVTTSQVNVSATGASDGSASVIASGGTGSYIYRWSPYGGVAASATGLAAGNYVCTITDANECSITKSFTITEPASIEATTAQTNVSCNGGFNGSATVTASGGATPYTYSWSPSGGTAATASSLSAGTYTVTITDANSITTTKSVTITQPESLLLEGSQTNVACNGGSNGVATVTVSGGAPFYSYAWSPSGGISAAATGLGAGSYMVTVTDANGCTGTRNYSITQPSAIAAATSQVNVSAFGAENGAATVAATGGTGSFTYSWAPYGGTAATATRLTAGTYWCTITDANGCTITKTFTITQPAAITVATEQVNISCYGGSNGSATVTASGGNGPFTYSWSPAGGTAATATRLQAGTYVCTITDANMASVTRSFTISQPSALQLDGSHEDVTVTGGSDGSAGITANGGTMPYSYAWSPSGGTASTASNLTAGEYICTVTDGNGCTATRNYSILQPAVLTNFSISDKSYGDPAFDLTDPTSGSHGAFTYTSSNKDVATINGTSVTILKPGTTTITVTQAANGNYSAGTATYTFVIAPKNITVNILSTPAIGKVYDGIKSSELSPANYQLNGVEANDDVNISGTAIYDSPDAGTDKKVTATDFILTGEQKDYYHLTTVEASATGIITPKQVIVSATGASKIYGDADPELLYTFTPELIKGDDFSGSLTRLSGEAVGNYAIGQGSLALSSNYDLVYTSADMSISRRSIDITADAVSKIYGDMDPALTYTFTPALIKGDDFSGNLQRAAGESAGFYKIGQGTLTLNDNYDLTYHAAKLTIGKKAVTVSATAQTKTYGDTDPALTYTVSPALTGNDRFSGSLEREAGEAAGSYAIRQGQLSLSSDYDLTYTGANFVIGKKAITVKADAKEKTYGDAEPAFTYTFAPALITGEAFTGSLTREAGENAGSYPITQGTLALNDNYELTYTGDNLVIGKKTIAVTAEAKTKTYGDADPALTYTSSPALIEGDAFTGTLTRDAGESAGAHAINLGSLTLNNNYTLIYTGSDLLIGKRDIDITAVADTKVYGHQDPVFGYTFAPALIGGDAFSGSLGREAGKNAGTYAITIGTLTAGSNYNVKTFTPSTFTITPAPLVITAEDKTKQQGQSNPAFTFKYDGLAAGDAPSDLATLPQGQTAAVNASPIGYFDITASSATSANYTITFVKGKLTVVPATSDNNHVKAWSNGSVLEIRIYSDIAQKSAITLYTVTGQPLIAVQKQLQPGINSTTIPIATIARGIYVLSVKADRFKEGQRVKVK